MPYGLILDLLFYGFGLHYMCSADASARSKAIVAGFLVASLLFSRWMPVYLAFSMQVLVSAYILVYFRLQGRSSY